LSELYGYSTPLTTFLVKKEFWLHRPVLIFQPTVNSRASDNCSKAVRTVLVSGEKCAVMKSVYIYIGVCGGVYEVEEVGGTFWLLNESLTFKGPAA
jgi:hypothetical protein